MSDILVSSSVYQGTFQVGTVQVDPIYQICLNANINAANFFEGTFWINENGNRVDNGLGLASYRIRDKNGALIAGASELNITPDVYGYYRVTAFSAVNITDLNHYVFEVEIPVNNEEKSSSIGLVYGE